VRNGLALLLMEEGNPRQELFADIEGNKIIDNEGCIGIGIYLIFPPVLFRGTPSATTVQPVATVAWRRWNPDRRRRQSAGLQNVISSNTILVTKVAFRLGRGNAVFAKTSITGIAELIMVAAFPGERLIPEHHHNVIVNNTASNMGGGMLLPVPGDGLGS